MGGGPIPGSGQNSTAWGEGILLASNQGGTASPNNLQLNDYQGNNELSNCEISEVLVYHRILDSSQLNAVGGGDALDPVNNLKFMAFGGYAVPEGILVSFDELRLSQTSLTEVAPLQPPVYFTAWAEANNVTGQTPDQDYDNDGVENGIEYFMGQTGSSFTAMPGLFVRWRRFASAMPIS